MHKSEILAFLPPEIPIELRSEVDFYGASWLVARKLAYPSPPPSYCSWKHGWAGLLPLIYPSQLVFSGSSNDRILVHTENHKLFLERHGYRSVYSVGMPFCYAQGFVSKIIKRIPNSLLVMPPHVTKYVSPDFNEQNYIKKIAQLKSQFSLICVCISAECCRQGKWASKFEHAGFPVLVGADVSDANALVRMATLFELFETVTSPRLGSHLVYAGLSGCKLALWGGDGYQGFSRRDLIREPYYQRNPDICDLVTSAKANLFKAEIASQFKTHPLGARTHIQWAQGQAGADLVIPPE
jgi:hypothetical protein